MFEQRKKLEVLSVPNTIRLVCTVPRRKKKGDERRCDITAISRVG